MKLLVELQQAIEHQFLSFEYVFGGTCILILAVVGGFIRYWIKSNKESFDKLTDNVAENTKALIELNKSYIRQESEFKSFVDLYGIRHEILVENDKIVNYKIEYLEEIQHRHTTDIKHNSDEISSIKELCKIKHNIK